MTTTHIIIVNWNGKRDTLECLRSVKRLVTNRTDVRTVVVDNGSTDGSQEVIASEFPDVHLILSNKNLGFSGGNNLGIEYALKNESHYIWLLNNDTVVDSGTLDTLLAKMTNISAEIVGPKIYFYPWREFHKNRYKENERGKVIWYAGGVIDWKNVYAYHRGVDEVDKGQYDRVEETEFVSGCSMFVKRNVFEDIGFFDERYYLYLEDLDFCLRAKRRGLKVFYVGSSFLWHKNSSSTDRPGNILHDYYFTRNQLLFGFRYAPTRSRLALLRQALRFVMTGPEVKRKAVLDALCFRFGKGMVWNH